MSVYGCVRVHIDGMECGEKQILTLEPSVTQSNFKQLRNAVSDLELYERVA